MVKLFRAAELAHWIKRVELNHGLGVGLWRSNGNVGASESQLPVAIRRLSHGKQLVVDVIGDVRSPHDRNQLSLLYRTARTWRTARERRSRSSTQSKLSARECHDVSDQRGREWRSARGSSQCSHDGACGESVATLWIRPAPQTVQATATGPSSGDDAGSEEAANGAISGPPISRRAAAIFSDRWRFARNP